MHRRAAVHERLVRLPHGPPQRDDRVRAGQEGRVRAPVAVVAAVVDEHDLLLAAALQQVVDHAAVLDEAAQIQRPKVREELLVHEHLIRAEEARARELRLRVPALGPAPGCSTTRTAPG